MKSKLNLTTGDVVLIPALVIKDDQTDCMPLRLKIGGEHGETVWLDDTSVFAVLNRQNTQTVTIGENGRPVPATLNRNDAPTPESKPDHPDTERNVKVTLADGRTGYAYYCHQCDKWEGFIEEFTDELYNEGWCDNFDTVVSKVTSWEELPPREVKAEPIPFKVPASMQEEWIKTELGVPNGPQNVTVRLQDGTVGYAWYHTAQGWLWLGTEYKDGMISAFYSASAGDLPSPVVEWRKLHDASWMTGTPDDTRNVQVKLDNGDVSTGWYCTSCKAWHGIDGSVVGWKELPKAKEPKADAETHLPTEMPQGEISSPDDVKTVRVLRKNGGDWYGFSIIPGVWEVTRNRKTAEEKNIFVTLTVTESSRNPVIGWQSL